MAGNLHVIASTFSATTDVTKTSSSLVNPKDKKSKKVFEYQNIKLTLYNRRRRFHFWLSIDKQGIHIDNHN